MRVFVAGAGGFLGGAAADAIERRGHSVIRHDRSRDGDIGASSVPPGVDAVVNCAGRLGGGRAGPEELRASNTGLALALGRTCLERSMPMIHVSTPGVTGLVPDAGEDLPLAPWGEYERTKADAETGLAAILGGPMITILRPDFVYGPGDMHKLALFRQVSRGWFPLVGEGGARLRPTYVADAASAVAEALPGGLLAGGLFNIGGPEVVSVADLVQEVAGALGRRIALLRIPRPLLAAALLLGPLRPVSLSPGRIALFGTDHFVSTAKSSAAGFEPAVSLGSGIRETVSWCRAKGLVRC
jgi:nucleoside-diphosphate-sugar epimerase